MQIGWQNRKFIQPSVNAIRMLNASKLGTSRLTSSSLLSFSSSPPLALSLPFLFFFFFSHFLSQFSYQENPKMLRLLLTVVKTQAAPRARGYLYLDDRWYFS